MRRFFGVLAFFCPFLAACQGITIEGRVIDEGSEPVVGATVVLKGSDRSTITDGKGAFRFANTTLFDTLVVGAAGYEGQEVPNNERGRLTVILARKATSLQEVTLHTGYQALPRERATGSFERLDNPLLNRKPGPDLLSRLEGVSTVYFDRRGQGRGGMTIRGQSTIYGDAAPLVVVDHFPYEGNINDLNPADIESITVLKDAAAASIWGVKAGNGVIVITTKKGQRGRPARLELNLSATVGEAPDLYYAPAMAIADFIEVETFLFGKGFYNGELNNTTTRPPLSPVVELLARRRAGTLSAADSAAGMALFLQGDVRRDLERYFYRESGHQQYALTYSGAAGPVSYYLSGGHDRQQAQLVRNGSYRTTFRSRVGVNPVSGLELWTDVQHYRTQSLFYNGTNLTVGSKRLYPYARLADAEGGPLVVAKDYRQAWIDTVGEGTLLDWNYRPLHELWMADNRTQRGYTRLALGSQYRFGGGLQAQLLYQYERSAQETEQLYDEDSYTVRNLVNRYYNPAAANKYPVPPGAVADFDAAGNTAVAARAQLNYRRAWRGRQEVVALAGGEVRQAKSLDRSWRVYGYSDELLTYRGVNFADNLPIYRGLAAAQPIPNGIGFSEGLHRFVSVFANGSYTIQQRYTATVSARKDASNLFGVAANQKGVPLWSAGMSWQLSREPFYKMGWLPALKLSVTYGYSGNTDPSLAALTTLRYTSGALFTNAPYARVQNPPNPELRWEKTALLNLGVDFTAANSRVEGSVEYYLKKGTDLIGEAPVDPTTGVLSALGTFSFRGNVAEMKGRGVDVQLSSRNLIRTLRWTTYYLFSQATTWVTRYALPATTASAFVGGGLTVNPVEGKPLYTVYGYPWAGLDGLTGDPQGYLNGQVSMNYTALVNMPVSDLHYHGAALPEYYGSVRNEWGWKGFTVSANVGFKLGYYFRRPSIHYNNLFRNWIGHPDYALRWQKAGDENGTHVPSLVYPNTNVNRDTYYNSSSVLVERGDHVRLLDATLGYEVGREAVKRLPVQSLRVQLAVQNLGLLWTHSQAGLDPDYPAGGFPLPRTIGLSIHTIF